MRVGGLPTLQHLAAAVLLAALSVSVSASRASWLAAHQVRAACLPACLPPGPPGLLPNRASSHASTPQDDEKLIGWRGNTYKPHLQPHSLPGSSDQRVFHLSWKPRSYVYRNFLTQAEAVHILKTAAPLVRVGNRGGVTVCTLHIYEMTTI